MTQDSFAVQCNMKDLYIFQYQIKSGSACLHRIESNLWGPKTHRGYNLPRSKAQDSINQEPVLFCKGGLSEG